MSYGIKAYNSKGRLTLDTTILSGFTRAEKSEIFTVPNLGYRPNTYTKRINKISTNCQYNVYNLSPSIMLLDPEYMRNSNVYADRIGYSKLILYYSSESSTYIDLVFRKKFYGDTSSFDVRISLMEDRG